MSYIDTYGVEYSDDKKTLLKCPEDFEGRYTPLPSTTRIAKKAFCNCKGLRNIHMPNTLKEIEDMAFMKCGSLSTVSIIGNIERIGSDAFFSCEKLKEVVIDSHAESFHIQGDAFIGCDNIKKVTISTGLRVKDVFHTSDINEINISEGCCSIDEEFLDWCYSLTDLYIPESIEDIEEDAFSDCEKLQNIYVDPLNKYFTTIDGILYNKAITELVFVPRNYTGTLVLPNSVETIRQSALRDCSNVATLVIPDALKDLPFLYGCESLTKFVCKNNSKYSTVDGLLFDAEKEELKRCPGGFTETFVLPNSVKHIGNNAFCGCKKINKIILPESLVTIGENALWHCESLSEITIPSGVKEIGGNAFPKSLTKIRVNENNGKYYTDGIRLFNKASSSIVFVCRNIIGEEQIPQGIKEIESYAYGECEQLTTVTFPSSLRKTYNGAFIGCDNLENVTLNEGLEILENHSFSYCEKLKRVILPNSLKTFKGAFDKKNIESITIPIGYNGDAEFDQWMKLKSVTLNDGHEVIAKNLLKGCETITDITIPSSVTKVEICAFDDCKALKNIHYEGTLEEWLAIEWQCVMKNGYDLYIGEKLLTSVVLDGSTPKIRDLAFYYCYSLHHVEIKEGVSSIGSNAFNKSNIEGDLEIPNSVKWVGDYAFLSCKSLNRISLPGSADIRNGILRYCDNLESIEIRNADKSSPSYTEKGVLFENHELIMLVGGSDGKNYDERDFQLVLAQYPCGRKASKYIIPEGVESIGDYAFSNIKNLSIVFPGYISMGKDSFLNSKVRILVPYGLKQKFVNAKYPADSIEEADVSRYYNKESVSEEFKKLVSNNPYRMLGVFANASLKEITANKTKLARYISVGKEVSFDADMNGLLTPIVRNPENIEKAFADLSISQDRLKHALTWFVKDSSIDEIALNHAGSGNTDKAIELLEKKETWSSLLNRGVLALAQKDLEGAVVAITKMIHEDGYRESFVTSVCGDTVQIDEEDLAHIFIDTLLEKDDSSYIVGVFEEFGEYADDDDYIKEKLIDATTGRIRAAIATAKNASADDSDASYTAGKTLMNCSKAELPKLKAICGNGDSVYGITADGLAKQILQCGINYYNNTFDDQYDRIEKALELQEYALSIAVGSVARVRCQKNVDIIINVKSKLPPREVKQYYDNVYDLLNNFKKASQTFANTIQLIQDCAPQLVAIKNATGLNPQYLTLSTRVVNVALNATIENVNNSQEKDIFGKHDFDKIKKALKEGWRITLYMDRLDKEAEFKDGWYKNNRDALKKLIEEFRGFAAGGSTFVSGQMVRTPSEYNVFGEALKIDLDMRTEEELFASCRFKSDYETYIRRYPKGKHVDVCRQKLAAIEKETWGKCNTLTDFWNYLKSYPDGEYRVEAARRIAYLEEKELWEKCKANDTIEDYQKYLNSTKMHQHSSEATVAIERLKEEQSVEEKLWVNCRVKEDYLRYLRTSKHCLHKKEAEEKLKKIASQKTALIWAAVLLAMGIGITMLVLFS